MSGRFGKTVMVVLGVILMLMFILPSGITQMAGSDYAVGELDGQRIRATDVRSARIAFGNAYDILVPEPRTGQNVPLPIAIFGAQYAEKLRQEGELTYLLLVEASANGVSVPLDRVENELRQMQARIMVEDPASPDRRRLADFEEIRGEVVRNRHLRSAKVVFDIATSAQRHGDYVKVSRPVIDYHLSREAQRVEIAAVSFDAGEFLDQVAAPSESRVHEQFEAYRDNPPGNATPDNPFGFGYRLPDRVRVQYLQFPYEQFERVVQQELMQQDVRERELMLFGWWREHREHFPTTPTTPTTPTDPTDPTDPADAAPETPQDPDAPAGDPDPPDQPEEPASQPGDEPQPNADPQPDPQRAAALPADPREHFIQADDPPAEPDEPAQPDEPAPGDPPPALPVDAIPQPTEEDFQPEADLDDSLLAATNPRIREFLDEQARQIAGRPGEQDLLHFIEVHDDVVQAYVDLQVRQRQDRALRQVQSILAGDFRQFALARHEAGGNGGFVEGDRSTNVGVPVDDPSYLERVADEVARRHEVRPHVRLLGRDLLTAEQLADGAVVGPIAGSVDSQTLRMPFAFYVQQSTLELQDRRRRQQLERDGQGLELFQPSRIMLDLAGNAYVFRVTEAHAAAAPEQPDDVADPLHRDLQLHDAFELASQSAEQLLAEARQTSLRDAANAAGRRLLQPEPFAPLQGPADPEALGGPLSPAGRSALADGIYRLSAAPADEQPKIGLVPIRPEFRILVTELLSTEAGWRSDLHLALQRTELREAIAQHAVRQTDWIEEFFSLRHTMSRTGFVPREGLDADPDER